MLPVDHDPVVGPHHKSMPASFWGHTTSTVLATAPRLSDLATPVLTVDRNIMERNLSLMQTWATTRDLDIAPHGKTTMAPALWARLFHHGATDLTLATPWQVQVARAAGINSIMLANTLVSRAGIEWISGELDTHPEFTFASWVDSPAAVDILQTACAKRQASRPIDVILELGAPGGRTGARTIAVARQVAAAVNAAPHLRLAGTGGYEGALAHDRSDAGLAAVRGYLREMADLHRWLNTTGRYETDVAIVTAGGSAYFDLVADELGSLVDRDGLTGVPTRVVLRAGAYLIHDDGFYQGISPLRGRGPGANDATAPETLGSAMHAFVSILSTPEPGLAIFDAGKRDVPFDEGLPIPQAIVGPGLRDSRPLTGATVTAVNDQHGFLRFPANLAGLLTVGTVVRLGLSHPCTAFDKWRLIPVIDDHTAADPVIVDLISTYF